MRPSTKIRYGLRAMIFLAQYKREYVSSKEIARQEKIPLFYLEKILVLLKKEGLIVGERGKYGGYRLSASPSKITLSQILKALDNKAMFLECSFISQRCPLQKKCLAKNVWLELNRVVQSYLRTTTLENIYEKKQKKSLS